MGTNAVLGFFAIAFGLFTLIARHFAPHQFAKLEPMKEKFGEKGGLFIHFLGYTVMPLIVGGIFLYKAFALGNY